MKKLQLKFDKLTVEYFELKDEILDYTDEYHDSMLYDIDGYNESWADAVGDKDNDYMLEIISDLENQVRAFRLMLKGLKMIKYIYS